MLSCRLQPGQLTYMAPSARELQSPSGGRPRPSARHLVQAGRHLPPVVVVEDAVAVVAHLADPVAVQPRPQVAVARLARQVVLEVPVRGDNLTLLETHLDS